MKTKRNLIREISVFQQRVYKGLILLTILFFTTTNLAAQTCIQIGTISGSVGGGNSPISVTLSPTCQVAGVVTGISIDGITTGACGIKWFTRVYVNGNLITNPSPLGCGFTGVSLNSYLPITSVTYEADSYELMPWAATITLNLNVTYSANFCSGTPMAGNAVVSTPVVCAGDTLDLSLSGQTAAIGLDYQWQSSLDNNSWSNMVNDTLEYVSTTLSNTSYYRCVLTCVSTGMSDTSTVDSVMLGFCTPTTDTTCSYSAGPTSAYISITGWQGMPLSDGILTFNYKGYLTQPTQFLAVTDALGNVYGQLDGSPNFCGDITDELTITLSQINSLLAAGNGSIDLIISAPSGVGAFCPTSGADASFCITASLRAANHVFADDANPGALVTPAPSSCVLDSNVSIGLVNTGSNALTSAQLNWSVNGVVQSSVSWTGNIASFATDTVSIGLYVGGFTNYDTLMVWPTLPNGSVDSNTVSDTLTSLIHDALSGTYTIAQNGSADFTSFTDAILTMESFGICGPVVFEATDLQYLEQLNINTSNIGGVDSLNTITFTSQTGDPDDVTITYASTGNADNFVVSINNSQYLTFKYLKFKNIGTTHNRVIFTPLSGNNHHITFDNCILESQQTTSSSNCPMYLRGTDNNNWTISNNTILNGYWGISLYDNSAYGNSNLIIGNKLYDQYSAGIYFRRQNDPIVKDNYITSSTTINSSAYAMNLSYYEGIVEISGNHVDGGYQWPRYGMYLGTANGTATNRIKIFNNRFYVPSQLSYRAVYLYDVNNADIYYNSIHKNGSASSLTNAGLMLLQSDSNNLLNNIIQIDGEGFAIYVDGGVDPILNSDFNCISVLDTMGFVAKYYGDTLTYLADWIDTTNFDSNSIVVNQIFSNMSTLQVCTDSLYGKGINISSVQADYEGDIRNNPPCIGADEFMPMAYFGFDNNPEICTGDTLVLEQYYFDTVLWWPSMILSNTLTVTTPGSYGIVVSGACGSDTSMFTVIPQLHASIGDTNLCEGTSAVLSTGISNGTYSWSDGSSDSTLLVSTVQTVSVSVISEWGCLSSDSATVTESFDVVLPDSTTFCEGGSVVLDANMAGAYLWNDGSTGQVLAVSASGVYSLTVTEQNCISSDTSVVEEVLDVIPSFTDAVNQLTVVFTNTTQNATSYLWDFGDGASSVLENPTHTYPSNPDPYTYTVKLTAYNSCGELDYTQEVSNSPDGVSELMMSVDLNIYPNPNKGVFTISLDTKESKNLKVEVLDVRGSIIYNQDYGFVTGQVSREINLENASKGFYMIRITLDEETAVYRLSVN